MDQPPKAPEQRQFRGLYRHVKISVKSLNIIIVLGIVALLVVLIYGLKTSGYTVTFDPNGGTDVAIQELRYGDTVIEPEPPTRQGYTFTGWYADEGCTIPWDFSDETVSGDLTLYAGWLPEP